MKSVVYFPEGYRLRLDPYCWTVIVPVSRKDRKTGKSYVDYIDHKFAPVGERGFRHAIDLMLAHHLSSKGEVSHKTFLENVEAFRDRYLEMVEEMAA